MNTNSCNKNIELLPRQATYQSFKFISYLKGLRISTSSKSTLSINFLCRIFFQKVLCTLYFKTCNTMYSVTELFNCLRNNLLISLFFYLLSQCMNLKIFIYNNNKVTPTSLELKY